MTTIKTEDWWAVWLGLGIIILAYVFYLAGSSISWIAVAPAKWSTFGGSRFRTLLVFHCNPLTHENF